MSPACDVCIPPLALQHKSQLVTFSGELWQESAKSPSFLLEDSGFYLGNCFSCNIWVFSSFLSLCSSYAKLDCSSERDSPHQPDDSVVFLRAIS